MSAIGEGDPVELLGARSGVVCAVGAGGKKSCLYAIARHHPGRVGLTTTVHTAPVPTEVADAVVTAEGQALVDEVRRRRGARRLAFACPSDKPGRVRASSAAELQACCDAGEFDCLLVKADGARGRGIKAPAPHEPVYVDGVTTVLAVVSAAVVGEPLDERVAHRPERVSAVTGCGAGEAIRTQHLAILLTADDGLLKQVGAARVIPVITHVDRAKRRAAALAVADRALSSRHFEAVVLADLGGSSPRLERVTRQSLSE